MNTMKILIMVTLCMFATACGVTEMNKRKATYVCKDKGGVYSASWAFNDVTCNNGEMVDWRVVSTIILPIEYIESQGINK